MEYPFYLDSIGFIIKILALVSGLGSIFILFCASFIFMQLTLLKGNFCSVKLDILQSLTQSSDTTNADRKLAPCHISNHIRYPKTVANAETGGATNAEPNLSSVTIETCTGGTMSSALRYKDKVTIITGGTSGIGRGCVEVFVRNGSKVVLCSFVSEEEGRKVQDEVNTQYQGAGECHFVFCDVTKESDIQNVVKQTVDRYGRIDCLINNAGQHPGPKAIDDVSADDLRRLLDINLVSYFLFAKYSLPYLRKVEGNIINTSSLTALIGQEMAVPYVSTKGAITAFTKALAVDEARNNVRVNCFSPSSVMTPTMENWANSFPDPTEKLKLVVSQQLLGRMATTEECGLTCLYLAADATFCTGININVSGGAELDYGKKSKQTLGACK